MSARVSVEELLANLERRAVYHREQETFHAQLEAHHRDQRAFHAAELAAVQESLDALRSAAAAAVSLARPAEAIVFPSAAEEEFPPPGRLQVSQLIRRVAASSELAEPFGPTAVAEEFNRRYAQRLRKSVTPRTASDVLRRLVAEGQLQLARKGKAVQESLYTRVPG